MSLIPELTDAGRGLLISALSGSPLRFSRIKIGNGAAPDEPRSGDYWYDTDNLLLKKYVGDWMESPRTITCAANSPASPSYSDLWYNTNTGTLYYYGSGWNVSYEIITCSAAEPEQVAQGDYWYDTANAILYIYGYKWNSETEVPITVAQEAPETPSSGDYWFDQGNARLNVYALLWAVKSGLTVFCADTAPTAPAEGAYWYDTGNGELHVATSSWQNKADVTITVAETAPESPAEGAYWYDTANAALMKYTGTEWEADDQPITVSDTAPESPATDDWWYNTTTSSLQIYTTAWEVDTAHTISYGADTPAAPESGDWWYNTTGDVLMEYGYGWKQDESHVFSYGHTAPAAPNAGDWWYDTTLHVYSPGWNVVPSTTKPFHYGSAAPGNPAYEDWYYDSAAGVLYEYGMQWLPDTGDVFTFGQSEPTRPLDGNLWYDTTANQLKQYTVGWVDETSRGFVYADTAPLMPNAGDWWYDSRDNVLHEYNGVQWALSNATISCGASPPATQDALTDLVNPMISIVITGYEKGSNYVQITGAFDNADVVSSFKWTETGVFAEDEDGNELLYAYCYTGEDYETIPSNDCGKTIGVTLTLLVMVGDAEDVTAIVGEGAVYATKDSLEEHKRDNNNPHGVSAEQIGLGNVSNTTPEETVVTYTVAAELAEPLADENTATVFGKIKKAIATLIAHLKAANPHSITVEKIKAAAEKHNHDAGDINSGVLGVTNGGTGCKTEAELAAKVGAKPVIGVYTGNGAVKRLINLGFQPSAVLLCDSRGLMGDDVYGTCGGICIGSHGLRAENGGTISAATSWNNSYTAMMITTNGFYVSYTGHGGVATNASGETYRYIAFR